MLMWLLFIAAVVALLYVDLRVLHRHAHVVSVREALGWSAVWIGLALLFNLWVYVWRGPRVGLEFLAGYLIEKSLSVDNLFVFLLIFAYFRVPPQHQHHVLFWGILGALVMRAGFILAGVALIQRFHWVLYLFGLFLVVTGVKLAWARRPHVEPARNPVLRLVRRFLPISETYEGGRFFVRREGRWLATPLLVVLLVVETTDILFAVDSIPAVLAVTLDPFIVFSSNVCAILGLRALYFALAGLMRLFHHLHYGLAVILVFVGVKMLLEEHYRMPIGVTLGVIAAALVLAILASLRWPARSPTDDRST